MSSRGTRWLRLDLNSAGLMMCTLTAGTLERGNMFGYLGDSPIFLVGRYAQSTHCRSAFPM